MGSDLLCNIQALGTNLCELGCPLTSLVAPEVSVLAAWREISLRNRKGILICRRLGTGRTSLGCHNEISALSLFPTFFAKK